MISLWFRTLDYAIEKGFGFWEWTRFVFIYKPECVDFGNGFVFYRDKSKELRWSNPSLLPARSSSFGAS